MLLAFKVSDLRVLREVAEIYHTWRFMGLRNYSYKYSNWGYN